jgi:hypothetical protein
LTALDWCTSYSKFRIVPRKDDIALNAISLLTKFADNLCAKARRTDQPGNPAIELGLVALADKLRGQRYEFIHMLTPAECS